MVTFFKTLLKNFVGCFSKQNVPWHVAAIVLTAFFVFSGFDWWWFLATRGAWLQALLLPAAAIGGLMPLVLPWMVLAVGAAFKNVRVKTAGWAILQAELLAAIISGAYKSVTGRIQPPLHGFGLTVNGPLVDNSHAFNFGFWEHGVFWGWPSTHTTLAFAMALTVFCLAPRRSVLKVVVVAYALYIGVAVSTNIHWFTDFAAGAIVGSVIGVTVARSFKTINQTK